MELRLRKFRCCACLLPGALVALVLLLNAHLKTGFDPTGFGQWSWRAPALGSFYMSGAAGRTVTRFDCRQIFDGNETEIARAVAHAEKHPLPPLNLTEFLLSLSDCDAFRTRRGYPSEPFSDEERRFPLAFTILMRNEVDQLERLLRAIYMPQNSYCIHVDGKEPLPIHDAVRRLAACFPNVKVTDPFIILYTGVSQLTSELGCLRDLYVADAAWKYYLNIAVSEFPLKTNRELVKIFARYGGRNELESFLSPLTAQRSKYRYVHVHNRSTGVTRLVKTKVAKTPPPHALQLWKSSRYVALSRAFVEFVLTSPASRDLLVWLSDTASPDESWWATLNSNWQIKSPTYAKERKRDDRYVARAVMWQGDGMTCRGKYVHSICVLGVGDLPTLRTYFGPKLIANKFQRDYQPTAFDCLEELHVNRTLRPRELDWGFYDRLLNLKPYELPYSS
ncbi:PREDICTED: N-acetyllactosaminide beta-1,6-N-acetylglucosaminyl-transferase, isoform B-like [Priapulus caudatus]|uniref:N-acetyllactosaminide beta-1,6-N-acetylglucosaminyl-transferase, isoform B-like n=1 Tax=Priapulus caudatus TaxID=37621 RepID=A0ABM1ENC0_PRICU|nr:PREDICTED: N-acetyllactosaminide beta-1,6-N-acetylglucosaminyl-transferase, isoform B-like [Priapulus caudatus]